MNESNGISAVVSGPESARTNVSTREGDVDALVLTATQDELDAVLQLPYSWVKVKDKRGFPYHHCHVSTDVGDTLAIATACVGKVGQTNTALRGQALLDALAPDCVAMCGICAGDRKQVALGDVVIANQIWPYDEGKQNKRRYYSMSLFDVDRVWSIDAAYFAAAVNLDALVKDRPLTKEAQTYWFLHALYLHEHDEAPSPDVHPDRKKLCPQYAQIVHRALHETNRVILKGRNLELTNAGKDYVEEMVAKYPDGLPPTPALCIHTGAMATVPNVINDATIFEKLRGVVGETLALDMEGAAIAELANQSKKKFLVVKAVQDFADEHKDDTFRKFGCRASAEILFAFLCKHMQPKARAEDSRPFAYARASAFDEKQVPMVRRVHRDSLFLDDVERVAKLRIPQAQLRFQPGPDPFSGAFRIEQNEGAYLRVDFLVAIDQPATPEILRTFETSVEPSIRRQWPYATITLVHTGTAAPEEMCRPFSRRHIFVKSFTEYQGLIDFTDYLQKQTQQLEQEDLYRPTLYVQQRARWSLGNHSDEFHTDQLLQTLWEQLDAPAHPRFLVVLGEFGLGKTFLLRQLARRMHLERHTAVPILVTMRKLEKAQSIRQLLAQHFVAADRNYDLDGFLYMLKQGRIALLFDGFDELALRLPYDRVMAHFKTIMEATGDFAKIVVTSRREHFLTDEEIKKELYKEAERALGRRFFLIEKFNDGQIRQFLSNILGDKGEAAKRYELIDEVKDLLGLSKNPRMLGVIAKIDKKKLLDALQQRKEVTSAKLYEMLVDHWLDGEFIRANPPGAPHGISREGLDAVMNDVARYLWSRPDKAAHINEIGERASSTLLARGETVLDKKTLEQMAGSGSLLVRDSDGAFQFMHRSVLEWFVARAAARQLSSATEPGLLALDELSDLMADFFAAMAGPAEAYTWAQAWALCGTDTVKKNALRVRQRVEKGWGKPAQVDDIPVTQDWSGMDFRGQDLSKQDFGDCIFQGTDFRRATLVGTNLSSTDLTRSRLGRANLAGANLAKANVTHADLSFASLVGADMQDLVGIEEKHWRGVKLVGAKGIHDDRIEALVAAGASPTHLRRVVSMWSQRASACNGVAWSGDILATAHADGTVRLWDTVDGRLLNVLAGHSARVNAVAFSPDGSVLASASHDKSVCIWNWKRGAERRSLQKHKDAVVSVAFSPDGTVVASGSWDKTVLICDWRNGEIRTTLQRHGGPVNAVAFSPDGQSVASGSWDKTVRIWDWRNRALTTTLQGHAGEVTAVAFSLDGEVLASGSLDREIRLWSWKRRALTTTLRRHAGGVNALAFSPDGEVLASASVDETVHLWNWKNHTLMSSLERHENSVNALTFSSDGSALASGADDKTVRLWSLNDGACTMTLQGYAPKITAVAFSPNSAEFASGSGGTSIRKWNWKSSQLTTTLRGHEQDVNAVGFSPDGAVLASGSSDKTVRLWDWKTGVLMATLREHSRPVTAVAFSPDGRAVASGSHDKTICLWDWKSGTRTNTLRGHDHVVTALTFSPDGETLASGSHDKTIRLWDWKSGAFATILRGHDDWVNALAFAPGGSILASGASDSTVQIWNWKTGTFGTTLDEHEDRVNAVAFSPDGAILASGSGDKTVRLWDWRNGECRRVLSGHLSWVNTVAFHPSGRWLVSGSEDGTLRVWDVRSGSCLAILFAEEEGYVAFTPDGRYKIEGDMAGSFWHVVGLCRFDPGELELRLPADADLLSLPEPSEEIQPARR